MLDGQAFAKMKRGVRIVLYGTAGGLLMKLVCWQIWNLVMWLALL